jgi:hypothetical protein
VTSTRHRSSVQTGTRARSSREATSFETAAREQKNLGLRDADVRRVLEAKVDRAAAFARRS